LIFVLVLVLLTKCF